MPMSLFIYTVRSYLTFYMCPWLVNICKGEAVRLHVDCVLFPSSQMRQTRVILSFSLCHISFWWGQEHIYYIIVDLGKSCFPSPDQLKDRAPLIELLDHVRHTTMLGLHRPAYTDCPKLGDLPRANGLVWHKLISIIRLSSFVVRYEVLVSGTMSSWLASVTMSSNTM